MRQGAFNEQVARVLLGRHQAIQPRLVAAGAVGHDLVREVMDLAAQHLASAGGEERELSLQPRRKRDVVRIHPRHHRAPRRRQGQV